LIVALFAGLFVLFAAAFLALHPTVARWTRALRGTRARPRMIVERRVSRPRGLEIAPFVRKPSPPLPSIIGISASRSPGRRPSARAPTIVERKRASMAPSKAPIEPAESGDEWRDHTPATLVG
jgi:hypothetical protein